MKIVYNYHPETKHYIGTSYADESPLEPGVWLHPSHSTVTKPLDPEENKLVVFNEETGHWEYQDIITQEEEEEIKPLTYQQQRIMNYPSIGDQLDSLFKAGVFPEEMAEQIQAVKDAFPKPTE